MPRLRKTSPDQLGLLEVRLPTAPCVPAIREAVKTWRDGGYKGASETTRLLLNHWFKTDHRINGRKFAYYYFQREAIETLIYLYEVAGIRRHKDLLETYAPANLTDLRLLQHDEFARYAVKMATGSGKTKVMALAILWQYFNAVAEGRDDYARTFLLIAPNVIVLERLKTDFTNGRIFRSDPMIPPALRTFWDFDVYVRGDAERAHAAGALYLTNIQQFHDRAGNGNDEPEAMTGVMGPPPPAQTTEIEDFDKRIVTRGGLCAVLNDEAHHTHDEDSEWNKFIRQLHDDLRGKVNDGQAPAGLAAQLDFTATPRYSKGALFTWTVYDYPLKQAILDSIVKRPVKGVARNIQEGRSSIASTRYKPFLTAGVERWKEYVAQLAPLKRKPVLFVMMNDTAEADEVADYLQKTYPTEFGGDKTLVIHTNRTGDVAKGQEDDLRDKAKFVDRPSSPINCIVSVLMLREGWDVEGVTVVVGLRPYTAKANILPEQTIGRGLRLMFRNQAEQYQERVDVIGNNAFIKFVEELEKTEEMAFETFEIGKDKLTIVTIKPDEAKLDKDISIPTLSPILARKKSLAAEIAALDVSAFTCPKLPRKQGDGTAEKFQYEGYDIITLQKLVEREYTIPEAQTSQEVISFYAKRIADEVKLPSQFAALAPKVREFLATKAFGEPVDLDDPTLIKPLSSNVAQYVVVQTFVKALRDVVVQQLEPQLTGAGRKLSETPPFPYSRPTLEAAKCVFNLCPCDNEFEKEFAAFLQKAGDVSRFSKLPQPFAFSIEYTDAVSNLRYYEPDFVAVAHDGAHYLIETKGREDVDVANKNRAAQLWCENASTLTGTPWQFVIVRQKDYEQLQPTEFADLMALAGPPPFA
ncbi:MAG: DEAD/DEAH box helicase family protein [Chloroflexi bacterium]|nr:DEAD/DEAH box helicase family protein [Chloroflexota bacterium]